MRDTAASGAAPGDRRDPRTSAAGAKPGGAWRDPVKLRRRSRATLCGIATERAGTTVEIACLYTICVTVFFSSTTYWSNDSIWPCSLMPLTR